MTDKTINNEKKLSLSKSARVKVWWRHQFLQGSWNYERMQNGGWAFSIIPAIKELYKDKKDQADALKRHLEFYNTHPYCLLYTSPSPRDENGYLVCRLLL